ncbi:hypothetical protein B0J13DRAFT_461570, partial [Dactylonectria estremocensis]
CTTTEYILPIRRPTQFLAGNSPGCGQSTANYQNYGNSFNANGGGVYAMEWTSDHISIWFFARNQIPDNIKTEFLDSSAWGLPSARFTGGPGCNIDTYFMSNNLVFDTTHNSIKISLNLILLDKF